MLSFLIWIFISNFFFVLTFCSLPKSISEEMDFAELYLLESNVEVVVVRVSGLFILKYRIETS